MVGYQAMGTRGRNLLDGAEEVRMHGEMVPVRAKIGNVQEFSVHADAEELLAWIEVAKDRIAKIFMVHGESGAAETLRDRFVSELSIDSVAPKDSEAFSL
jgi:metallo-beta-lactamase family protein